MILPKKDIIFKGTKFTVYSIGWLSVLTHRSTSQIRRWQRDKLLPPPLMDIPHPMRWYLADELMAYTNAFKSVKVQRGQSIHKTGFKIACRTKQQEVRAKIEGFPDTYLYQKLPNEQNYHPHSITDIQMKKSGDNIGKALNKVSRRELH